MRKTILITVIGVAVILFGCSHYSGDTLRSLSDRNVSASEITAEMCRDFATASQAAIHGNNSAWTLLGKASEMRGLSIGLSKHSVQCFSAIERLARKPNPMSEFHHGAMLEIFKRTWRNTKILAGDSE